MEDLLGLLLPFYKSLWFPQHSLVPPCGCCVALGEWLELLRSKLCLGPSPTNHRRLRLEKRKKCPDGAVLPQRSSPSDSPGIPSTPMNAGSWEHQQAPSRVGFLENQERGKNYTPFSAFTENV